MSEARREAQRRKIADEAAAYLRQREALRPTPMAFAVRRALGGRLDKPQSSVATLIALGVVGTYSNRGAYPSTRGIS